MLTFSFLEYLFFLISYALGSIPFGFIVTKLANKGDITKQGSGNIGATNVSRIAGKKLAALVLAFDLIKGFLPVFIYKKLEGVNLDNNSAIYIIAGCAILGHVFSIFMKFKGGKGVATALGVILALNSAVAGICVLVWIIIFKITKISSASALCAFALSPFIAFFWNKNADINFLIFLGLTSILIFFTHRSNIKRLLNGEEGKIK